MGLPNAIFGITGSVLDSHTAVSFGEQIGKYREGLGSCEPDVELPMLAGLRDFFVLSP